MVIMLLGMTLLVGLVFFVYNLGDQVNQRLEMQNAADAVAISGGAWLARSMNVTAMNNWAQAKLIGIVPVMDSLPLAASMAHHEAEQWAEALTAQLARGVPADYLRTGLESLQQRMITQRDILKPFHETMNGGSFRMEEITHWSVDGAGGSGSHGKIWRAAMTLGEFSEATLGSAGMLSQHNAVRFGMGDNADAAFMVPVVPEIPARRGEFEDFRPVLEGRLHVTNDGASYRSTGGKGGAIPDYAYPHRLGPWARLHRWRDRTRVATNRVWVPPREGARVRSGQGSVNVGGRRRGNSAVQRSTGRGGYWQGTDHVETGYTTYGPYDLALRYVRWYARGRPYYPYNYDGELADTYFNDYVRNISRIKLGYMFGSGNLRRIHNPEWMVYYPDCKTRAQQPNHGIKKTMFYLVEIASSVPENDPRWLSAGTYRTNGERAIAIGVNGWQDPDEWGVTKIANYIWQDSYTYETTRDESIGIYPQRGPDGREIFQTVYLVAYYVFGGIDVGQDVEVSNPCNWNEDERIPAPILLDTSEGDYDPIVLDPDQGIRREKFTFLGVVRKHNRAPVWPQQFQNANPLGSTVTVAQVKLFNNSSWDLWTQDWRAELTPVSNWEDWVFRLGTAAGEAGLTGGLVTQEEVEQVYEYMARLNRRMADRYLSH